MLPRSLLVLHFIVYCITLYLNSALFINCLSMPVNVLKRWIVIATLKGFPGTMDGKLDDIYVCISLVFVL